MGRGNQALIDFLLVCLMPADEWEPWIIYNEDDELSDPGGPDDPDNWISESEE